MRPSASIVKPILFLDLALLFAIVPLLPAYQSSFGLTKTQVGLVVAAYSATVVVAAVPVGHMADRVGAHRMTVFGVWLLAASTLAFGLAGGFWTLILARAGQGLSSSISWSAGLAWLSHATPHQRRGRAMGTAMAYASSGGLLGPVFGGTLGHSYGIRATFVVLAAAAAVLALLAAAAPAGGRPDLEQLSIRTAVRRALVRGPLLTAVVISVLVAVVSGTLETLVPLRLGVDGYSVLAITAVLTAAGVLAVITNWVVGRLYDRVGGIPIALAAILGTAVCLGLLVGAGSGEAVAAIYVVSAPFISSQYAVQFPMAADGADHAAIGQSSAFGMLNLSWGVGFVVGPAAGAALASLTADWVTYALLLVLALVVAARLNRLAVA